MQAAELHWSRNAAGFSRHFGQPQAIDALYESIYVDVHRRYAASRPRMQQMLSREPRRQSVGRARSPRRDAPADAPCAQRTRDG